jgi:myo-inositol-1(or 4)-monophosphatase
VLQADLNAVTDIAREAGEILLSYFGTDRLATRAKGDRDVVTAADLASEHLLLQRLSDAFPGDGVVGEEGTRVPASTGRRWLIDPLDGTLNFAHGIPIWCVSVALFEGAIPILGVVHDPIRAETFSGARGLGAWCNGSPAMCSEVRRAASAVVHLTIDFNERSLLEGLEDIRLLAPRVMRTRNIGSAALALAYVAAGRLDAMLHRFANAWDYGAGAFLVQEAGGSTSGIDGEPYTDQTFAIAAAATPELRAELLSLLRDPNRPTLQ